jgi:hypothetical protein
MLTLYARKEKTNCPITLKQYLPLTLGQRDVVLYEEIDCKKPVSRYTWHYTQSKPDKRNKYIMHNCNKYRLVWVE